LNEALLFPRHLHSAIDIILIERDTPVSAAFTFSDRSHLDWTRHSCFRGIYIQRSFSSWLNEALLFPRQ